MQLNKHHNALLSALFCLTFTAPTFAADAEIDPTELESVAEGETAQIKASQEQEATQDQVDSQELADPQQQSDSEQPLDERDQAMEREKAKLAEDPTKVVTQAGISYGGETGKISASLGLGPVNKINARMDFDAEEWRIGGSWLFDVGIVNVNFGKKEFDDGSSQNNYSIGTFMPLSYFGFEPWGTQIFALAGYSYNDGEIACETSSNQCGDDFSGNLADDFVFVPSTSSAGYAGFFGLKPITDKWRVLGAIAGSLGSNDYSGYMVSIGTGYSITKRQSLAIYGFIQDNSYGNDEQVGISYKYQFN